MAIADEGSVTQYVDKIKKQTLPTFAVCLAAFNGTRWLSEQMDSILNQQGVLVTVFVSVDLSSDGTEEWFNQRGLSERRIIL
jgi:rhamnosyltransferase